MPALLVVSLSIFVSATHAFSFSPSPLLKYSMNFRAETCHLSKSTCLQGNSLIAQTKQLRSAGRARNFFAVGASNLRCKLDDRAFRIGDAVEAMWIGDDGWYPGVVEGYLSGKVTCHPFPR